MLHLFPLNNCSRGFFALETKQGDNVDYIGSFMIRPVLCTLTLICRTRLQMGFLLVKKKERERKKEMIKFQNRDKSSTPCSQSKILLK